MKGAHGKTIRREVFPYFPFQIQEMLNGLNDDHCSELEEIRLRCGRPIVLRIRDKEICLNRTGKVSTDLGQGYIVSADDLARTIAAISDNSIYAFEEDIKRGFITVPGGHRVGLAGQILIQGDSVRLMKDFSSLCFRIAREVKGCARIFIEHIWPQEKPPRNTLLLSPPRCGKTTVLRDIARILSAGDDKRNGCNVVVVDERSELAGCYRGVPQLDVGPRTDVLDGCPKHIGMNMALRAMAPQVIITDELGSKADVEAVRECINAGIKVISSIHASNLEELQRRPFVRELLAFRTFDTALVLSRRRGPGSLEDVVRMDAEC